MYRDIHTTTLYYEDHCQRVGGLRNTNCRQGPGSKSHARIVGRSQDMQ